MQCGMEVSANGNGVSGCNVFDPSIYSRLHLSDIVG